MVIRLEINLALNSTFDLMLNTRNSRILEFEFEVVFNGNSKLVKEPLKKQVLMIIDHPLVGFARN